jgi:hypothetical protein
MADVIIGHHPAQGSKPHRSTRYAIGRSRSTASTPARGASIADLYPDGTAGQPPPPVASQASVRVLMYWS